MPVTHGRRADRLILPKSEILRLTFQSSSYARAAIQRFLLCPSTQLSPLSVPTPSLPSLRCSPCCPLPPDPSFPQQAIGLVFLLDQAPRQLLSGIDERWTFGFFDQIAKKAAEELLQLPETQRPVSQEPWYSLGYDISHWAYLRCWIIAVLVHSEDLTSHTRAAALLEETRVALEQFGTERDSLRDRWDNFKNNINSFFGALVAGAAKRGSCAHAAVHVLVVGGA